MPVDAGYYGFIYLLYILCISACIGFYYICALFTEVLLL